MKHCGYTFLSSSFFLIARMNYRLIETGQVYVCMNVGVCVCVFKWFTAEDIRRYIWARIQRYYDDDDDVTTSKH